MNDSDLIDELREGMRAHTDHTEVPAGFADDARRTARRRSARRAAAAGTPLLAAAGVATVLVTGVGSRGSTPAGAQSAGVTVGGGQAQDTAYILGRVRARLAADARNGAASYGVYYRTGQVSPDGSLVDLGWKMDDGYAYVAPDGTQYSSETQYWRDGSVQLTASDTYVPAAHGHGTDTETVVNPASHRYSRKRYSGTPDPIGGGAVDLFSTPSQVGQALQSGQVSRLGTATIDGTPVIALSVAVPSNPPQTTVLYVDAQSDQPVRMVQQVDGSGHVLHVENWLPATTGTIARAKADTIPTGDTEASPAEVY